jgi:hypothetical protein
LLPKLGPLPQISHVAAMAELLLMFDSCVFSKAVLCEQGVRVARERGQMPILVFPIVKTPSEKQFSNKI